MKKVVPLEGFGGGGTPLNFKIVAYATEEELAAAQPKENTIGVITDVPITGYKFSTTEPEGMVEGEVWICTGTTSDVKFDIANGVTIYPLSAKQYIGGVWVKKITMSYQSGEWNKWIFIIIQNSEFVHTSLESPDGAVVINTRNDGSGLDFYRTGTQYGALILKTKDKIPKHIEQIEIIGRFTSGSTNSNDYKIFFISEHETWPEAYNNRIATFSPFTTISATNSTEIIDLSGVNIDAYLWIAYSCGNNAANTAIVIKDIRELVLT